MIRLAPRALAFWTALVPLAGPAAAAAEAETDLGAHVTIELNAVAPVDAACRMSFLIQNGHASDIRQAVFEAVLFDDQGRVERLTLFDFGELPAARPRVRPAALRAQLFWLASTHARYSGLTVPVMYSPVKQLISSSVMPLPSRIAACMSSTSW